MTQHEVRTFARVLSQLRIIHDACGRALDQVEGIEPGDAPLDYLKRQVELAQETAHEAQAMLQDSIRPSDWLEVLTWAPSPEPR